MPFVLVRCATQSFDALAAAEIDLGTVIGIRILGLGPRLIFDWPLAAALQEKRLLGPKELGFSLVNPGTGCLERLLVNPGTGCLGRRLVNPGTGCLGRPLVNLGTGCLGRRGARLADYFVLF